MSNLQKTFGLYLVLLSFLVLAGAAEAGLVAGYLFDGDLTDETATYDGTMHGFEDYSLDIPPVVGASGLSLLLDGASSVEIPVNPCLFSGDADFSIVAWFKTYANTGNCIISSGPGGQAEASHSMATFMNPESDGAIMYDNFYVGAASTATDGLNDGAWHHYAISYTASGNTFNTYINGDLDDDDSNFYPDFPCSDPCISTLIGDALNTAFPVEHGEDHWDGLLDDVKIYDEALTQGQIESIMGEFVYTTIYVDASASFGGDGASWDTAYKYLQDALAEAISGDTIYVAEGTYKPDQFDDPNYVGGDRADTFQLISGLPIYGGFPSGGSSLSERDPNQYKTILSGDLAGDDVGFTNNGENSYHVVKATSVDATVVLDGFTITAGNADGSGVDDKGGGMYIGNASPTATNCIFRTNYAELRGGGMYNANGNPSVTDCSFIGNSSNANGGGMCNFKANSTITNCVFRGNEALDGGAMNNYTSASQGVDCNPLIVNCTFTENLALKGGGMYNWVDGTSGAGGCSPTLINCSFIGNGTDPGGVGGGMCNWINSTPTLVNCIFSGNLANPGGSGIGGAIYNNDADLTTANCSFSSNSAFFVGGMYNAGIGISELENCIFWGNSDNLFGTGESAQITNSGALTIDYSCVQGLTGGLGGTGNIGDDPCFVDADGPDNAVGTEDDDLRLGSGSACIDAGDNTAVPADTADLNNNGNTSEPTPNDLDGNPRFNNDVNVADTGNGTAIIVDMGAYEVQTLIAYVDDDAPSDPWPGDPNDSDPAEDGSADHPFDAIQEAVDAIAFGGTVTVLEGTYTGPGNCDIDFEGKAFTLTSTDPEDPCVVAATIIDPNVWAGTQHRGFYFHNGEDANSVVAGFTITNCSYENVGGGIYCDSSSPTITNCTLKGNYASDGGGMFSTGSSPTVTNCLFIQNASATDGGGALCDWHQSSSIVTNCTFTENWAGGDGGAIHILDDSSPTFTNCAFVGNSVSAQYVVHGGGAIFNGGGSNPTLTNCAFSGNRSPLYGGAIHNGYETTSFLTITNCSFSGNTADEAGGAIYCQNSRVFIAQSESEFSDTQEQDNWQYGYYVSPFTSATFQELDIYDYGRELWYDQNLDPDYPLMWIGGGIPGYNEWVVRRWVSEVAGDIRISGSIANTNAPENQCGDGTTGHIIVDGSEEWNQYVSGYDPNGFDYSIIVNVGVGDTVDFAIDPYGTTNWCDQTMFTASISQIPPTDYVEIKNCILWDNSAPQGPHVALVDSDVQFTYCDLEDGEGAIYNVGSTINWGDGNIDTDPIFVNDPCAGGDGWGDDPCTPGTDESDNDDYGDLHLQGPSLCIDTGDPCSDYSNEPQANGNRINMGAYGNTEDAAVSTLDSDGDDLADPWELFFGLDPDDDDMDDDGLLDGIEACYDGNCYTYDPYDPATGLGGDMNAESGDTDEDMLTDAWEVQYSDVISPINENDVDDDPDGDLYMNFEEFIRGTEPNNPLSKPTPMTFYVDDITDPCEDGSSGHPFDAIQEAMDIAISWDTVIVSTGTYTGTGNRDIDFDRRRITLTSTDPENASVVAATIIDCQGDPCNLNRGFYFNGSEDANSVLAGFTITNGYQNLGGGIRCDSSSPTINYCTFSNNSATRGGGINNSLGSNPMINYCTFTGNSAGFDGGGMRNNNGSNPTIANCTFTGNSAEYGGGIHNNNDSNPMITNSTFTENSAEYGGGMSNNWTCSPPVTNCTFTGNNASTYGGGIYNLNSDPSLKQCILWANIAQTLAQIYDAGSSATAVSYSDVQGGWTGTGNIDEDPNLTPNPHLRAGSPCIDAGDPAFVVDPCAPYDIDGEARIINGRVDIGADEYLDTDADGLPDFWESLHFESATGAGFSADPDNDGLTNLQEYELFSSDPNTDPIYVDVDNPADPCEDGSLAHPFNTIQEGLDAADDGDTVLVKDGTYTGTGNKELDFAGKSIVLNATTGAASTTIDCDTTGRAFDFDDGETAGAAVIGFTITGGQANYGGAIRCDHAHPQFRDCIITANTATVRGGGVYSTYSTLTFADCTISSNEPNGIWAEYGGAKIFGDVKLDDNDCIGNNLMLTGDGTIKLYSGAKMDLADSEIRCNIAGMYDIIVDVGETLTVGGDSIVDLATLDPAKSNPNYGTLDCKGKLKVKGKAKIIHANIYVTEASVENEAELSSNFISVNSWAPYGQFFVGKKAKVYDNEIHTDGDRIMNLEPDVFEGLIADNDIYMTITEGVGSTRGGLLELRGQDGWASSTCDPCDFFCQVLPGTIPPFDPNTWTLEELELLDEAKLNLTNLFDFQKPYDSGGADEVLYVKHLVLGADSILNTAYNQIYYDTSDIDPSAVVVNEPLLGFSLINIAFDDEIEFLVRVAHNNYVHPTDPNFDLTYIERIEGHRPDPAGMMRMKNIGDVDARAKGLFSKAEEDQVLIRFEYLFETADPDVELVIYLSNEPELLSGSDPARAVGYIEVDRVRTPLAGQPGSAGSDRFGVYQSYVSPGNLNFVRGTRIELELIGPDAASVLINNWDPQVHCSGIYCKDVTGDKGVTVVDFLTVIGEYGESAEILPDGTSSVCLDGVFSNDGYVDGDDISGWDWTLNAEDRKNLCNTNIPLTVNAPDKSACSSCPPDKSASVPPPMPSSGPVNLEGFEGSFLVAGKMYDPLSGDISLRFLTDRLFGFDELAQFVDRFDPVYDRANGRLVTDSEGEIYQLNLEAGLVRLADAAPIIPSGQDSVTEPRYGLAADVYVGLQGTVDNWSGRPILDAAFGSDGFVYVVPVVVEPVTDPNLTYTAAAKIQLTGGGFYDVVQLYDDPDAGSENDNRELNWLREIEVDSDGLVYVINAHSINESDVLWVYDAATGKMEARFGLSDPNAGVYLPAPVGMHVSDTTGKLYIATSRNHPEATSTSLYVISKDDLLVSAPDELSVQTIDVDGLAHITDVTVDPVSGTAWVLGFKMEDIPYKPTATDPAFYEPYITVVPYGSGTAAGAVPLCDPNSGPESNLALPSSIVWTGAVRCGTLDLDDSGTVNFADFAIFMSRWRDSDCVFPDWCDGADVDPLFDDRGDVDIIDLDIFARYWLESCPYPE